MRSAATSLSVAVSGSPTSCGSWHGSSRLASGILATGTVEELAHAVRSIAHDRAAARSRGSIDDPRDDGLRLVLQGRDLGRLAGDQLGREPGVLLLLLDHRLLVGGDHVGRPFGLPRRPECEEATGQPEQQYG